ncbi:BolA family transcriptional regulator [Alteromonas aestuariivivens]|uniref:DNA-binding transcriptional regulator BolA n=1 Tax=Alteromonas aestuariivivens TaxID=1938339 RepID=A0A3D8MCW6_9ALTE|nr:BolA/IbaG family iron-sulfur metabolism protein [Alteromonas aestuariivivens]RDV28013.1 BolA family transcriptional regulator [Alteromonas aestuariivivens]
MQDVKQYIESQLNSALAPLFLQVADESHMHNVPPGAQSHFKVTVVSEKFNGTRLIARHRQVNALLAEALQGPVHALAMHTYTPDEWRARGGEIVDSPQCRGGSSK